MGKAISLVPLQSEKLPEFREILGGPDFGGCFCAVWSSYDDTWIQRCEDPGQPNYFITEAVIRSGKHLGFLVYQDGHLVAWTGSGPKSCYPFLAKKLASRLSPSDEKIWSIGCLAIREPYRGQGLSASIVKAVSCKARSAGATHLEAYPVRPGDEARRFRGSHALYQRLGFAETATEQDPPFEIVLMTLDLSKDRD